MTSPWNSSKLIFMTSRKISKMYSLVLYFFNVNDVTKQVKNSEFYNLWFSVNLVVYFEGKMTSRTNNDIINHTDDLWLWSIFHMHFLLKYFQSHTFCNLAKKLIFFLVIWMSVTITLKLTNLWPTADVYDRYPWQTRKYIIWAINHNLYNESPSVCLCVFTIFSFARSELQNQIFRKIEIGLKSFL